MPPMQVATVESSRAEGSLGRSIMAALMEEAGMVVRGPMELEGDMFGVEREDLNEGVNEVSAQVGWFNRV